MSKKTLFSTMFFILCCCNAKAFAADGTGDMVISGQELRKTVACSGNNIVIDANDSVLTFRGACNEIQVNGSTNILKIETVASIVLNSADNKVSWTRAAKGDKPKVVDRSSGNKIEQSK